MTTIRLERPDDAAAVRDVNEQAFEQPAEARLVDKLRQTCETHLALVAAGDDTVVVGHILFTPVTVDSQDGRRIEGMGLAPMAVTPGQQRRGIGSALVSRGLDLLRKRGCPFVVVVGHPDYYPKFGFAPAAAQGLACQWEGVPDEAFMALILDADAMRGVSGVARYRPEFDEAE